MEGYDAKFDPPLDKRLECPICLLAQREPMQTPCGHRFCSACILRALRETGPRCPVDNTRVAVHQLFKDNFAKREVLSLHVHCHAQEHGCTWEGELRNLECHIRLCELVTIDCPNECSHRCQRKNLYSHLPQCSNKLSPCPHCYIHFPRGKLGDHGPFCSKIKLPSSVLGDIEKASEILKWSGHLKMKVQGQTYSATGYLTVKADSEERFIPSACWSSNLSLIPLTGPASRIFWRTLEGPEVKPVTLNFSVVMSDPRAVNFQKNMKKKFNAAVGLRLKPSSRRELMILYLYWSEQKKRMMACVAELRNYLVREMQSKLQQLKRTSMHVDRPSTMSGASNRGGSSGMTGPRGPPGNAYSGRHGAIHERMASRHGNYSNSVRLSVENQAPLPPASHVLPSLLSWQLSPSFPAYPWRMQAASHSLPFFTIPSTPPQFLPATSYPYTFAPMPAIAAPPFSINPIQPVPASIAIPSYAGVSMPQVTGMNSDVVVSSAANPPSLTLSNPEVANNPIPPLPATMLPHFTQEEVAAAAVPVAHAIPMATGPSHAVNQVSVVVDPRINPSGLIPSQMTTPEAQQEVAAAAAMLRSDIPGPSGLALFEPALHHMPMEGGRRLPHEALDAHVPPNWMRDNQLETQGLASSQGQSHVPTASTTRRQVSAPSGNSSNTAPTQHWDAPAPGPSSSSNHPPRPPSVSPPSSVTSGASLFSPSSGLSDNSDDDSDGYFPALWTIRSPNSQSTPSSDESSQSSPSGQPSGMGSALQTLADSAVFPGDSPTSSISDEGNGIQERPVTPPPTNPPRPVLAARLRPPGLEPPTESFQYPVVGGTHTVVGGAHTVVGRAHAAISTTPVVPVDQRHYAVSFANTMSNLEDLPVFVPVIHPSNEPRETEPHGQIPVPIPIPHQTHRILYAHQDAGAAINVNVAEVPPLIHVAQGSHSAERPWAMVAGAQGREQPRQLTHHQHHQQELMRQQQRSSQNARGGFWEEVMPSLDMRLQNSQQNI